jgi:DNA-directed RNA polymerase alpha subunit
MIDYDQINLNEYALKLRRDGKTFKQIGDELGVSRERARQRVAWASRHEDKLERHEAATTMGDLFMSERAMNTIKNLSALDMTFDEFLDNVSHKKMMYTPNLGKVTAKEIINTLKEKNVSKEKLAKWENKKTKKKRRDAGIPKGPEEKYDTCQKYVIDEGRRVMGRLCNEPLTPKQKKFCDKHKP